MFRTILSRYKSGNDINHIKLTDINKKHSFITARESNIKDNLVRIKNDSNTIFERKKIQCLIFGIYIQKIMSLLHCIAKFVSNILRYPLVHFEMLNEFITVRTFLVIDYYLSDPYIRMYNSEIHSKYNTNPCYILSIASFSQCKYTIKKRFQNIIKFRVGKNNVFHMF